MDRVILPEAAAVKHPVQPVQHEVRSDQEHQRLHPQRQLRQRPVAVFIEGDQVVGVVDVEDNAGAEHQQPDTEHPRECRHEEPVEDVGDDFALAPPRLAGLQAQKWVSTVNTRASAIVTGTTFSMVVPSITMISIGRPDMTTSRDRGYQGYPLALKEP